MIQLLKKNWLYILIAIMAIIIFLQRCNNGDVIRKPNDTTYIHDTIKVELKGDVVIKQIPYRVEVPILHDTLIYLPDTSKDGYKNAYLKAMLELDSKNYYEDSIEVSDTNGLKGFITFYDTVYRNKLLNKGIKYDITYPKIKKTVTITKYDKPKNQVYVGTSVLGNTSKFIGGVKIDLSLKNRKDQIYEIGAQYWNNEVIYSVGTKWLISFKKK